MTQTFYLLILTIFTIAADANYCGLRSCDGGSHTMCKYRSPAPSNRCIRWQSTGLTLPERREILKMHNNLRSRVSKGLEKRGRPGPQPPATNLGPLRWDNELAAIAQRWANQCNYGHDTCRNVGRFQVGQNIAYVSHSNGYTVKMKDLIQMMRGWYDEVALYDRRNVHSHVSSSATGHYTQMVWADTKTIGCGVVRYRKDNYWFTTYLVCNYGPTGNWLGKPVYDTRF